MWLLLSKPRTTAHPSGLSELSVVIKPDGLDAWLNELLLKNFQQRPQTNCLMWFVKLVFQVWAVQASLLRKSFSLAFGCTDILIVNAAAWVWTLHHLWWQVASRTCRRSTKVGIEVVEHILQPKLTVIGIEDNKPDAIKALEIAAKGQRHRHSCYPATKYPSGGEKHDLRSSPIKEVPAGGIPADIGVLVQNVGSLYSIKRAVIDGEPVVNRVVT